MNAPRLGYVELVAGQAVPESTVNEIARYLEQGANVFAFKSRTTAAEPGTPADGDCYLIPASPTGTHWSTQTGKIAFYENTAWVFLTPKAGFAATVADESYALITYNGSAWGAVTVTAAPSAVASQSGTTYTAVLGDAGTYIRFSNAGAITFTIPPNSSVAFPIGTVIEMEQAGAGALSVAAGGGVTVNSRGADLTLAGQYSVAAIKKVATDTWTLTGDL